MTPPPAPPSRLPRGAQPARPPRSVASPLPPSNPWSPSSFRPADKPLSPSAARTRRAGLRARPGIPCCAPAPWLLPSPPKGLEMGVVGAGLGKSGERLDERVWTAECGSRQSCDMDSHRNKILTKMRKKIEKTNLRKKRKETYFLLLFRRS